jgi:probable HAF family extracellular repeat protein
MIVKSSKLNLWGILIVLSGLIIFSAKAQVKEQKYQNIYKPEPGSRIEQSVELKTSISKDKQTRKIDEIKYSSFNVYTVTNLSDAGNGSLRKAIDDANNNAGKDIISFNIPGTGLKTILPLSPLPEISDSVVIDGTTQPGYLYNPVIEIDGAGTGISNGLIISGGNSTLKSIAINSFSGAGVGLISEGNMIEGCYIGVSPDGTTDKGNGGDGIVLFYQNNQIGNSNSNRNVISGNSSSGIRISNVINSNITIENNYIGTDASGSISIPNNFNGIYIFQSSDIRIGGSSFSTMNIISGNFEAGIRVEGGASHDYYITANRIGTSSNGSVSIANKHGIEIIYGIGAASGTPSNITIGGNWTESQNLISGNLQAGVAFFLDGGNGTGNVVAGNLIGTDATGNLSIPNTHGIFIQRDDTTGIMPGIKIGGSIFDSSNVISGNTQFGIWIKNAGTRNNLIFGNYVGTTRATPFGVINQLGNGFAGVLVQDASDNKIGDENLGHGNIISSNSGDGIAVLGVSSSRNKILSNYVGTDSPLGIDLGNGYDGIFIEGSNTIVGGFENLNEIAYNDWNGIFINSGDRNQLNGNVIYKNGIMGIDLYPDNITPNDSGDIDLGPNLLQNFPILDSVSLKQDSISIFGKFYSIPLKEYTLHFYKSNQKSPSHFGEGQFFIDSMIVTTDDSGWAVINVSFNESVSDTQFITAIAVDEEGNTSEFSRALCLKDSDGDGIYDCWESDGDGIDVNADGIIDLNLYSKGARPDRKDIFVELDYMFSYRPLNSTLERVKKAFSKVPYRYVDNPNEMDGINLIIEMDDNSLPIPDEVLPANPWVRFFQLKKQFFGTDDERANTYAKEILEAKRLVYRYCIWGNKFGTDGNSGKAELTDGAGGNDFLIALGSFNTVNGDSNQQAGTFMHELGHTLGLRHGGIDDINYKPNYYSVMNYTWQFPSNNGWLSNLSWDLVYSTAELETLNENNLNEAQGLNPLLIDYPNPILFPFSNNNGSVVRIGIMYPSSSVDWDGSGDSSGFAGGPVDINVLNNPPSSSPGQMLISYADWENLKYNFRLSSNYKDPVVFTETEFPDEEPEEMTPAIYNYLQSLPPYGIVPPRQVESSLIWLGTLGGNQSEAFGVSDDGKIVVGYARDSTFDDVAFKWTINGGMQNLGTLGGIGSEASGISADGSTIVGFASDSNQVYRAFKWTEAGGMQDIGAGDYSKATGVSSDGSYITVNVNQDAFRWSESGMINLGTLGGNSSGAAAISHNGNIITGYSYTSSNDPYAFRWTEGAGMINIGTYYSFALGISGDGRTITGFETGSAGLYRAFKWQVPNVFQMNIAGNFSSGWDASYDGKYIVGDGANGAFRLSDDYGLEFFNSTYSNLLAQGSEFYTATAVSDNGRYVVGYGKNSLTNRDEAYLLDTGGLLTNTEDENHINLVQNFLLSQNFPNPFNPITNIEFYLPSPGFVKIKIYDLIGQEVLTLLDEERTSGFHRVTFNASNLSSGIYFYRIQAGDFVQTRKMILLK